MSVRVDGRPYQIDVYANPELDAEGILISGFPDTYLDGATATCPVRSFSDVDQAAGWTVEIGDTSILLSLPQADVATIGVGNFTWTLLLELANGSKPSLIGGSLKIGRGFKPSTRVVSDTVGVDGVGADVTITVTQVFTDTLTTITGGNAAGTGSDVISGGSA